MATTDMKEMSTLVPPKSRARFGRHPLLLGIGLVIGIVITWLAFSLGAALFAPGTDSNIARLAEWARGHGGSVIVNNLERFDNRLNPPHVGGVPASRGPLPSVPATIPKELADECPDATHPDRTPVGGVTPVASPALAMEGCYHTLASENGQPVLRSATLRPDNVHTAYLAGVAWMSGAHAQFVLHPGTVEPGHGPWAVAPSLMGEDRRGVIAAFNSGFRLADSRGGYYAEGRQGVALRDGAASFVVAKDGSATVGQWGRDITMTSNVESVRQNLVLLVDNGKVVDGIAQNSNQAWGATVGNNVFVWRSGIGVTNTGDLVYVGSPAVSASSLAELLVHAGAVRAMELDINRDWVSFSTFAHDGGGVQPTNLLPSMYRPADRYLSDSSRDFYAVNIR